MHQSGISTDADKIGRGRIVADSVCVWITQEIKKTLLSILCAGCQKYWDNPYFVCAVKNHSQTGTVCTVKQHNSAYWDSAYFVWADKKSKSKTHISA